MISHVLLYVEVKIHTHIVIRLKRAGFLKMRFLPSKTYAKWL